MGDVPSPQGDTAGKRLRVVRRRLPATYAEVMGCAGAPMYTPGSYEEAMIGREAARRAQARRREAARNGDEEAKRFEMFASLCRTSARVMEQRRADAKATTPAAHGKRVRKPQPVARTHGRERRSPATTTGSRRPAVKTASGSGNEPPPDEPPGRPSGTVDPFSLTPLYDDCGWTLAATCRCDGPILEPQHDMGYSYGCVLCGREYRREASS